MDGTRDKRNFRETGNIKDIDILPKEVTAHYGERVHY